MTRLGSTFAAVPRSGVRAMLERADALPGTIRLELGDPEFPTPQHIVDAALAAASAGFTHYTPSAGLPSLRAAAAGVAAERHGIACTQEMVAVTTGACGGLFAAVRALLDPGDELLVPDPGWTGYAAIAGTAGVAARPYPLDRDGGFTLDPAAVEDALTPTTRAIVVNSPGNPAGNVADAEAIEAVVELASSRGVWVIADEAYEALAFDGRYVPAAAYDPSSVVSVFTCSKTYAMTGWRVGYLIAPVEVARAVARVQESVVTSVSSVSQKAAEAALTGPQDVVATMRETYRRRLGDAMARLDAVGAGYVRPRGAFYLLVDVSSLAADSAAAASELLDGHGVAVVPGSAFGAGAEGLVRVSACVSDETLAAGLERLVAAVATEVGT